MAFNNSGSVTPRCARLRASMFQPGGRLRKDETKRGVRAAYSGYPGYRALRRRSSHAALIVTHNTSAKAASAMPMLPEGIADPVEHEPPRDDAISSVGMATGR